MSVLFNMVIILLGTAGPHPNRKVIKTHGHYFIMIRRLCGL